MNSFKNEGGVEKLQPILKEITDSLDKENGKLKNSLIILLQADKESQEQPKNQSSIVSAGNEVKSNDSYKHIIQTKQSEGNIAKEQFQPRSLSST